MLSFFSILYLFRLVICAIMVLEEYGAVSGELRTKIMKQTDLQILDEWVKLAIHTKDVNEFVQQSGIAGLV